jgi:hypothetical protein
VQLYLPSESTAENGDPGNIPFLTDGNVANAVRKGLDKVRLSAPLPRLPEGDHLDSAERPVDGFRKKAAMHEHTFCEATELPNGRVWGVIEGTPAYVLGSESNVEVPGDESLMEVADTMRAAFEAIMEVEFKCGLGDMNVNRLDLPYDMRADSPLDLPSYIRGLGSHAPTYSRKRALYLGENGAETLMAGSGARSGRVYDKHTESGGNPLAEGVVRFEPQLRKGALRREGITTLGSIGRDSLERIRHDAFGHFGWDLLVLNGAGLRAEMRRHINAGDIGQEQAWRMLGAMVMAFEGVTGRTVRRYRRIMSDLGLAVDLDSICLGDFEDDPVFVRADYETGRLEQYALQ